MGYKRGELYIRNHFGHAKGKIIGAAKNIYRETTCIKKKANRIYLMAENGANCPCTNVITTESECKAAANQIQKSYEASTSLQYLPAGCFVSLKANEIWFNTITDP